jgi:hypothetical protein
MQAYADVFDPKKADETRAPASEKSDKKKGR